MKIVRRTYSAAHEKRTLESRSSGQLSSTVLVASEDAEWQKVGQAAFRGPALSKCCSGR